MRFVWFVLAAMGPSVLFSAPLNSCEFSKNAIALLRVPQEPFPATFQFYDNPKLVYPVVTGAGGAKYALATIRFLTEILNRRADDGDVSDGLLRFKKGNAIHVLRQLGPLAWFALPTLSDIFFVPLPDGRYSPNDPYAFNLLLYGMGTHAHDLAGGLIARVNQHNAMDTDFSGLALCGLGRMNDTDFSKLLALTTFHNVELVYAIARQRGLRTRRDEGEITTALKKLTSLDAEESRWTDANHAGFLSASGAMTNETLIDFVTSLLDRRIERLPAPYAAKLKLAVRILGQTDLLDEQLQAGQNLLARIIVDASMARVPYEKWEIPFEVVREAFVAAVRIGRPNRAILEALNANYHWHGSTEAYSEWARNSFFPIAF